MSFRIASANGSVAPLKSEKLTIEPEVTGIAEQIVASAVSIVGTTFTITTSCLNAHSSGAWLCTEAPLWLSNRRSMDVVVTAATSADPEKRRKIHEVMARHVKTTARWEIVAASSATQVGPFVVAVGKVGATALGAAAVTF